MVHVITRWLRIVSLIIVAQCPFLATALAQDAEPQTSALPDGVNIVANGPDNPRNFTRDFGALINTLPALGSGIGEGQGGLLRIDLSASVPISLAGVDFSIPTCNATTAKLIEATGSGATTMDNELTPETVLLQNPLTAEWTKAKRTFDISCLTLDEGGSEQTVVGGGASVFFIEAGRLSVACADGSPPLEFVPARMGASSELKQSVDGEVVLESGDTLVMPAESAAEFRNSGDTPVMVLLLLGAPDAAPDAVTDVSSAVLACGEEVTISPGVLTLERVVIPAGQRREFADAPVQTVAASVDPRQAMILSGCINGFATNRGDVPVSTYLLTIEPPG